MAIGGKSESIYKGASIGLLAGAGIGGYFVVKDKMATKPPSGEIITNDNSSKIYDSTSVNDYDDIYYGKKWEAVGEINRDPQDYIFEHQLNKIKPENDLVIYFSLFQKTF